MHALAIPELDAPAMVRYGVPALEYADNPAVATGFSKAVNSNYYDRLLSVYVTLVTDANVADRYVSVQYKDPTGLVWAVSGAAVAVTASSTQAFHFSAFHPESAWPVGGVVIAPLVPLLMSAPHTWNIVVQNVQAGDQLSTIRYMRDRFYTTQTAPPYVPEP